MMNKYIILPLKKYDTRIYILLNITAAIITMMNDITYNTK